MLGRRDHEKSSHRCLVRVVLFERFHADQSTTIPVPGSWTAPIRESYRGFHESESMSRWVGQGIHKAMSWVRSRSRLSSCVLWIGLASEHAVAHEGRKSQEGRGLLSVWPETTKEVNHASNRNSQETQSCSENNAQAFVHCLGCRSAHCHRR